MTHTPQSPHKAQRQFHTLPLPHHKVSVGRTQRTAAGQPTALSSPLKGPLNTVSSHSFSVLPCPCFILETCINKKGEKTIEHMHCSLSVQFSSVAQLGPTLCHHMECSTLGFPVHRQLPEPAQTHVH